MIISPFGILKPKFNTGIFPFIGKTKKARVYFRFSSCSLYKFASEKRLIKAN